MPTAQSLSACLSSFPANDRANKATRDTLLPGVKPKYPTVNPPNSYAKYMQIKTRSLWKHAVVFLEYRSMLDVLVYV